MPRTDFVMPRPTDALDVLLALDAVVGNDVLGWDMGTASSVSAL
jgi:hypothetical protein